MANYDRPSSSPGRSPEIPGPPGIPLLGAIPSLLGGARFEFLLDCWRRYGDIFRLPLLSRALARGPQQFVVVSHPDAIERVVRSRHDNYVKGSAYDPVRLLMGRGLLTSEGPAWVRQRKLIQPAFRRAAIREFLPTMQRCTDDMLARWQAQHAGGVLELHGETMDLARRIIGLTMFGTDLGAGSSTSARAVIEGLELIGRRTETPLSVPMAIPTPDNLRLRRAQRALDEIVHGVIARARRGDYDSPDPNILQAMIAARDEATGAAMTDAELRDEVLTLYIAGHETTALTLTWSLYHLATHPEVRLRVEAELERVLGDGVPTLEDLERLVYTRMVIDETLRLRPPAWLLAREVASGDELLGRRVEAGSHVLFYIWGAHRHPAFWGEAPEAFDPERFTAERAAARHPFAYLPFSAGPRGCVGKQFSLYESLLALAAVLRRFRLDWAGHQPLGFVAAPTVRPGGPVTMRLTPRAATRA